MSAAPAWPRWPLAWDEGLADMDVDATDTRALPVGIIH